MWWSKDGKRAHARAIGAMFAFGEDTANKIEILIFFMNVGGR